MSALRRWRAGEVLPEQTFGPITRTVLALYAGGSGDHNPMHIDIDFARRAGAPDVFAHGMLSMAYLMQYVAEYAPPCDVRSSSVRFLAITPANVRVTCGGQVTSIDKDAVRLAVSARIDDGTLTARGEVVIRAPVEESPRL